MAGFDLIANYADLTESKGLTPNWYNAENAMVPLADPTNVVTVGEAFFLQFSLGPCLSEIYPVTLKVLPNSEATYVNDTICESELPYSFNGQSFGESGIYELAVLSNSYGCDSIVLLNLEVIYLENLDSADAGSDQIVTEPKATLNSNLPAFTTGYWSNLNGAILTNENEPITTATALLNDNNTFTWNLEHPLCGLYSVDTVHVFYKRPFFLPNTFTPNGDGDNDLFTISGLSDMMSTNYQFTVFNRWGSEVFHSNNYQNDWDGKDQHGEELLEGTYYFVLTSSEVRYSGYVILVR